VAALNGNISFADRRWLGQHAVMIWLLTRRRILDILVYTRSKNGDISK
jgi:hypothetical protein